MGEGCEKRYKQQQNDPTILHVIFLIFDPEARAQRSLKITSLSLALSGYRFDQSRYFNEIKV